MADPEPRPGAILLTNTSQVGVNASGYAVLHDPDYLLLETGTTDAMLLEQGTTDGLLLEPYDCACCGEEGECGNCTDVIGTEITIDLGTTGFSGVYQGESYYYGDHCDAPCENLTGEIVLTQRWPCYWSYEFSPFCLTGWPFLFDERVFYAITIIGQITWASSNKWVFAVIIETRLDQSAVPGQHTLSIQQVIYTHDIVTGPCSGQTWTATKLVENEYNKPWYEFPLGPYPPCVTSGLEWDWPSTVDILT